MNPYLTIPLIAATLAADHIPTHRPSAARDAAMIVAFAEERDVANDARAELDRARRQVERELADVERTVHLAQTTGSDALGKAQQRLQGLIRRPGHRPLVLRSSDMDAKAQTQLEEDLNVMVRVLDRALTEKFEGERGYRPMGIDLMFMPGSGPMRSLYLEGYGAVFFLQVDFPLLPGTTPPAEEKPEPPRHTAWDEARQELYGGDDGPEPGFRFFGPDDGPEGPVREFDPHKVEQLKDAVLAALTQASNIGALKPADNVSVCVFGSTGGKGVRTRTISHQGSAYAGTRNEVVVVRKDGTGAPRGSVMTFRATKADLDALGKDKAGAEAVRQRVTIQSYPGHTPGGGFGMNWIGLGQ
jgi:hypothetical protein